jgi:hypothetical protein
MFFFAPSRSARSRALRTVSTTRSRQRSLRSVSRGKWPRSTPRQKLSKALSAASSSSSALRRWTTARRLFRARWTRRSKYRSQRWRAAESPPNLRSPIKLVTDPSFSGRMRTSSRCEREDLNQLPSPWRHSNPPARRMLTEKLTETCFDPGRLSPFFEGRMLSITS